MSDKELKFTINVSRKHVHPTISLISYISNIVHSIFKAMDFRQGVSINSAGQLDVTIKCKNEDDLLVVIGLIHKYGKVIQNKIPMNKLVGDEEKNIIALKKLLDLIFVELHIFSEIELEDNRNKENVEKLKTEVQEYLVQMGDLLENLRHKDDKAERSDH